MEVILNEYCKAPIEADRIKTVLERKEVRCSDIDCYKTSVICGSCDFEHNTHIKLDECIYTNKFEDLEQTVPYMISSEYQDRFIAEYYQLSIRTKKLEEFLNKMIQGELAFEPSCSYDTLNKQLFIMKNYLEILKERASIENIKIK